MCALGCVAIFGACQPAQDDTVIPTLLVLPTLTPTATHTDLPTLTPLVLPTDEPTEVQTDFPTPTATELTATPTPTDAEATEMVSGLAVGADELEGSPTQTATQTLTATSTRTNTSTATRTSSATATRTNTQTATRTYTPSATRTPFPTVISPSTITQTPVLSVFTNPSAGDDEVLAPTDAMPTLPIFIPESTIIAPVTASRTPTATFTRTATSNVPPTLGSGGSVPTASTPSGGAPGESNPPPQFTGLPPNTPSGGEPPIILNPSPTTLSPGGAPVDPPPGG